MKLAKKALVISLLCILNKIGLQHERTENLLTADFSTQTEYRSTKDKNY